MPGPFRQLTLAQFSHLLSAATLARAIRAVHVHHTWRPRRVDFRGVDTIEAMRRYHVETNGWSDIAQHLTIDPQGGLWTGRNWNMPPASAAGHNGTREAGPFMIEMVGDFDKGQDAFDGAQRDAAVEVVALLLHQFGLTPAAVKFHRDLGSPKTCPGSGIDRARFAALVRKAQERLAAEAAAPRPRGVPEEPFRAEHLIGYAVVQPCGGDADPPDAGVTEDGRSARSYEDLARDAQAARQAPWIRTWDADMALRGAGDDGEWRELRPHVVNLSRGELSSGGVFRTSPHDLITIVESIDRYARTAEGPPRVVLHAHGGLVKERSALAYAKTMRIWWLAHGVYPVFFVWESGLFETLRQYLTGPRDLWDYTTDPAWEVLLKLPGTAAWNGMKESARRASAADTGSGGPGGALQFAGLLADLVRASASRPVAVHAVGHSAGAIFHAHLLPVLAERKVSIASLSLLAPAVRADVFKEKLLPLVTGGGIAKLALFTMEEDAERQDNCAGVYRKSLLYLVSRSFEGGSFRRPLLGLHESLRKDGVLAALFGLAPDGSLTKGQKPKAELQLSWAPGRDPNPLTRALAHGCFDNDPFTMSAVLRRICGRPDDSGFGMDSFPEFPGDTCAFAAAEPDAEPTRGDASRAPAVRPARGRKTALCVGIDAYADRPLSGCRSDARAWGRALETLGFSVTYLFDTDATRDAIVDTVRAMLAAARAGDVLAWQYAGHGTQVKDLNGDESDRFDEALVPCDYAAGRLLIDDDIGELLSGVPRGALLTLFMDCCHPGTNSRFAPAVRALESGNDRVRYLPVTEAVAAAHIAFRRARSSAPGRVAEISLPGVIHFAACQDHEYAWESGGHGDFTAAATPLLGEAAQAGRTNEAFLDAVRASVVAKGRQHPMMMLPPANLRGRRLLAPFATRADSDDAGAQPAAAGSDADLLAHVEAIAAILRGRAAGGRGWRPRGGLL